MDIGFEKKSRVADIFAKVAEYTVAILIFGSIISKEINSKILVAGLILFIVFFLLSIVFEPNKKEH